MFRIKYQGITMRSVSCSEGFSAFYEVARVFQVVVSYWPRPFKLRINDTLLILAFMVLH